MRFLSKVVFAVMCLCVLAIVSAAESGNSNDNDIWSGTFPAAQAERGKKTFNEKCSGCHETSRFSGDSFHEEWDGKALKEIWDIASGTMPEDNPGSLQQQEYADIIAYFLSLNSYATGDAELQPGAAPMGAIKVEKKQ